MSRVVRIDDDIWAFLAKQKITLGEDHNDLFRRLLRGFPQQTATSAYVRNGRHALKPDKDYTKKPIVSYELDGRTTAVNSFKDLLVFLCEGLRERHANEFDEKALSLRGKKRPYFSRSKDALRYPYELSGSGVRGQKLFVETNLSANSAAGLCHTLVGALGHSLPGFKINLRGQ